MEDQQQLEMREINLRDYWRVLQKRRWTVGLIFLTLVTAVAVYSLTMTPVYRATAQVLIEKANPNVLSTQELVAIDTSGTDFYQTQYKVLESRSLAREVIRRVDLAQTPEYRGLADGPEKPASGVAAAVPGSERRDDGLLINAFLSRLKIEPIRNSRLVKINFESVDPGLAARTANTLTQVYIDWGLGLRLQTQQKAAVFLDEQVKEAKRKLEASEHGLQQYRERFGVAALAGVSSGGKENHGGQDISRQKLAQVNAQLVEATNRRIESEIHFQKAREALKNPEQSESIPEAVNNPVIITIKNQEVQLLREKTEKGEKFGPKHPAMVALTQEIEGLRKKKHQEIRNIVEAMRAKYEAALAQERSLQGALSRSQSETIDRDRVAIQYQVLQQEVETSRGLYDLLLKRLKETNVSEENRSVNIHVVDPAEVPKRPAKPRLKLNLLLAGLVGLMLGLGAAFFLEYLDNTVKTPDDLRQFFDLAYLGPVPVFSSSPDQEQGELVTLLDPKSSAGEAYRGLRTSILFSTPGHSPKTLLVTSSGPGEGKTLTSANLAIAMAQAGQRVLLLDCDMRRPRLHKLFGCAKDEGISNILVGDKDWRSLRKGTGLPNLEVIPSGPIPPNPAELVGSERMKQLLLEVGQEYDRIFIDSPPIVAVTDSVVLSRFVEGVVLVIQVGVTGRDVIATSLRQLKDVQAHVLGAVLNAVNIGKDNYYYYQYYYYYYGESGDKRKTKRQTRRPRIFSRDQREDG